MTKKTGIAHGAIEIDYRSRGIARRNVPSVTLKPGGGGLKLIVPDLHEETAAHQSAAHLVAHRIFRREPAFRELVNHAPIRIINRNYTIRTLVCDFARSQRLGRNKRLAHRRGQKARTLLLVTGGAVWSGRLCR